MHHETLFGDGKGGCLGLITYAAPSFTPLSYLLRPPPQVPALRKQLSGVTEGLNTKLFDMSSHIITGETSNKTKHHQQRLSLPLGESSAAT